MGIDAQQPERGTPVVWVLVAPARDSRRYQSGDGGLSGPRLKILLSTWPRAHLDDSKGIGGPPRRMASRNAAAQAFCPLSCCQRFIC